MGLTNSLLHSPLDDADEISLNTGEASQLNRLIQNNSHPRSKIFQNFHNANFDTGDGNSGGRGGDIFSHNQDHSMINFVNISPESRPQRRAIQPRERPSIFFGRDALLNEISDTLSNSNPRPHIALLGTGGIGKTHLALAIINEQMVLEKFKMHRYFVSFDDIDGPQITYTIFVQRIARFLGIDAEDHCSISSYMRLQNTILVLDNAESFLHSGETRDISRITAAIDEFGALPSVSIVITSRSLVLPRLRWKKIYVPNLDETSAYETFTAIYSHEITSRTTLDDLFMKVEYHALTVTLLAHVAEMNLWTIDMLAQNWKVRRTKLLNSGYGKDNCFEVSVQLSLSSPNIHSLGNYVERLLYMIAFFPQGVQRESLENLFPTVTAVNQIKDGLLRHSLVYYKDEFVTMLSPIRLYICNALPGPDAELLQTARDYYRSSVAPASHKREIFITSEDVNIEFLLAHDLSKLSGEELIKTLNACLDFIDGLRSTEPRRTILQKIIPSVDTTGSQDATVSKMLCLRGLSHLARFHRDISRHEELKLRWQAHQVAEMTSNPYQIMSIRLSIIDTFYLLGQYKNAQDLLQRVRCMEIWERADDHEKCMAALTEGRIKLSIDAHVTGSELFVIFASAQKLYRGTHKYNADICVDHGAMSLALVDGDLQGAWAVLEAGNHSSSNEYSSHGTRSAIAFLEGDMKKCTQLLKRAREDLIRCKSTEDATDTLFGMVIVAVAQGALQEARSLLSEADKEMRMYVKQSDLDSSPCLQMYLYVSGVVDLSEGHLQSAAEWFRKTKEICEAEQEFKMRAVSARAMGEVAHMLRDITKATKHFGEAVAICNDAGIPPKLLYRDPWFVFIARVAPAFEEGWPRFLHGSGLSVL